MNEDTLVILGVTVFLSLVVGPSVKKFFQQHQSSAQRKAGSPSKIAIMPILRSAFATLFQEKRIFLTLLAMVTVVFLLGLPSWAEFQRLVSAEGPESMGLSFLSMFGASNPYESLTSFSPSRWNYVYSGFFYQLVLKVFIAPVASVAGGMIPTLLSAVFGLLIVLPFLEAGFLLWLKYVLMKSSKIDVTFIMGKIRIVFPQLVVFHLLTTATFSFLAMMNWADINPVLVLLTSSTGEVLTLLQNLAIASLVYAVRCVFLVVPVILVYREEKTLSAAGNAVVKFFQKYSLNYVVLVSSFFGLAIAFATFEFVLIKVLPTALKSMISPWTYYGLVFMYLEAVAVTFGLGWLTIAVMKFVEGTRE